MKIKSLFPPASNIYEVLSPLCVISKILGLAPFAIARGNRQLLKPHFGITTLLRFVLMGMVIYYINNLTQHVEFTGAIAKLALLIELYLGTFATGIALVMAIVNQKSLISAIAIINGIDQEMKHVKLNVANRRLQVYIYVQIVFLTIMFTCNIALQFFIDTDAMLITYSCFNMVDYITSIMLCQYINLLLMIRQRFVWLNAKIQNLKHFGLYKATCLKALIIYRENEKGSAIEILGKLYYKLCHVSRIVNRVYGVQLLVLIGCSFITITTQLIEAYYLATIPGEGDAISYLLLLIFVTKVFMKIFAVVAVSENTSAKAHDTGVYLHDLWQLMVECRHESPSNQSRTIIDQKAAKMLLGPTRDIYDTLIPVFVVSKILGHAPFILETHGGKRKFVPHCGIIVLARFVLVIGTMCYFAAFVEENEPGNIAGIALRCELYLGVVMTGVVLILGVTNQKDLINSVERLIDIDKDLTRMGIPVTYKNARRFAYAQIISITCVFLSKIIIQFFSHSKTTLIMYSSFNVVDYLNTIMLFQYLDVLLLIRQRFIWFNRKIRGLSRHGRKTKSVKVSSLATLLDESGDAEDLGNVLVNLAKLYNKMCRVSKIVNRTYGVQLLVTICTRFIMITTQLINTYDIIRSPTEDNEITYSLLTIYLALHSSKIFMIASISENTAAKARHTGIYLHNLWEISSEYKTQIEYFSLQVLHQDLKFTACGFFNLDYTLIYSLTGAVATYFVIVIQFDKKRE